MNTFLNIIGAVSVAGVFIHILLAAYLIRREDTGFLGAIVVSCLLLLLAVLLFLITGAI